MRKLLRANYVLGEIPLEYSRNIILKISILLGSRMKYFLKLRSKTEGRVSLRALATSYKNRMHVISENNCT